jgi:thiaminase/transcriptional activator TenA
MSVAGPLYGPDSLLGRLVAAEDAQWRGFVEHSFVAGLADGTLPAAAFRHYLVQDYLFLIHFARAWGLAVYKADCLAHMRAAAGQLKAILDSEMDLHVGFCSGWGIDQATLESAEEDTATLAYTRYVLERGQAGDLLDLHVVLAPCMVGYGEIGRRLVADPATQFQGNTYAPWIEMYGGDEFQAVAADAVAMVTDLGAAAGLEGNGIQDHPRFAPLARSFGAAVRLETAFWQMGLDAARS